MEAKTPSHVELLGGGFLPYLPPYFSRHIFGHSQGHFQKYGAEYGANMEQKTLESIGLSLATTSSFCRHHERRHRRRGTLAPLRHSINGTTLLALEYQ